MPKVEIDSDDQNEEGVRLYVGESTIITVWDALYPDTELELAEKIAKLLREEGEK
jgi:hypothetical protein